jgi:hypothetical protein
MIVFVDGPHGEQVTKKEQNQILKDLAQGSYAWRVNETYNNVHHFSSHNAYEIKDFFTDLQYIVNSKYHKLQVMGNVHTDPYGHTSGMIGQLTPYGEFAPALTKDTYIRFKIHQDPNHFKILKSLDHFSVFHYLVRPPHIEKLQLHPSIPVTMYPIPEDLIPSSRYTRSQITFINNTTYY